MVTDNGRLLLGHHRQIPTPGSDRAFPPHSESPKSPPHGERETHPNPYCVEAMTGAHRQFQDVGRRKGEGRKTPRNRTKDVGHLPLSHTLWGRLWDCPKASEPTPPGGGKRCVPTLRSRPLMEVTSPRLGLENRSRHCCAVLPYLSLAG